MNIRVWLSLAVCAVVGSVGAALPRAAVVVPLDGNSAVSGTRARDARVHIVGNGQYADVGNGFKGLNVTRHAYDQATTLRIDVSNVPIAKGATVAFRFCPDWDEGDGAVHTVLFGRPTDGKRFSFDLVQAAGGSCDYHFNANTGGVFATAICSPKLFKKGVERHYALQWKGDEKRIRIYVDGKILPGAPTCPPRGDKVDYRHFLCNAESKDYRISFAADNSDDRFKARPAGGIVRDFRVYDEMLEADEIAELATGVDPRLKWGPVPVETAAARAVLEDVSLRDPLEATLFSLDDAERSDLPCRKRVSLNGVWRFAVVTNRTWAPEISQRAYTTVPGSYRSPLWPAKELKDGKLVELPTDPSYEGGLHAYWLGTKTRIQDFTRCWYERLFEVPADFAAEPGRICVRFDDIGADEARVYVNGALLESFEDGYAYHLVSPKARTYDVTDHLKPGRNKLTVFVRREWTRLWRVFPAGDGLDPVLTDVWLETRRSPLTVEAATAFPSVGKSSVAFRTRIENRSGLKGKALVGYSFQPPDGSAAKTFSQTVELTGARRQVVGFEAGWKDPILWDCENPNLYRLTASVSRDGRELDRTEPCDWGFRELSVADGSFVLNGQKARFRLWANGGRLGELPYLFADRAAAGQYVRGLKSLNHDGVRFVDIRPVSTFFWRGYFAAANAEGFYSFFPMPPYRGEKAETYVPEIERFVEAWGNNPSVVMWYTDFNRCHYPRCQDPAALNDTDYVPVDAMYERTLSQHAEDVIRAIDPSRECMRHAGGNAGKVFTSMNYQSFGVPIREQADWPRQWSERHTQPLFSVETCFPIAGQYEHFDDRKKGFFVAEHAARFFGDDVFGQVRDPFALPLESLRYPPSQPLACAWDPVRLRVSEMLYRRVVKAWRGYDKSAFGDFYDIAEAKRTYRNGFTIWAREPKRNVKTAGVVPERLRNPSGNRENYTQAFSTVDWSQDGAIAPILREAYAPLLVFLGGAPENFTERDHAYWSGEKVVKSVVIVNDRTTPRDVCWQWRLRREGMTLCEGKGRTRVPPGGIVREPIAFVSPEVLVKTRCELVLEAADAGVPVANETFALQVFPRQTRRSFGPKPAALYDPNPSGTEAVLMAAGLAFKKVGSPAELADVETLIVGRNALKTDGSCDPFLSAVETSRFEQGLNVVVFEQRKGARLGNLQLWTPSARESFVRRRDTPLLDGLDDADLSDWRGDSDSLPAFVLSAEKARHYPRSKWKCGNGNMVAGCVFRQPQYGRFRPIADCGFDLRFTPLMEYRRGRGRAVLCQYDVTCRYGKDPAATRLVDNILEDVQRRLFGPGEASVRYVVGDEEANRSFVRAGLEATRLMPDQLSPGRLEAATVLLVGGGNWSAEGKKRLKTVLTGGAPATATVLLLPGAPLDCLPVAVTTAKKPVGLIRLPENEPWLAGVRKADVYFHGLQDLPVLAGFRPWDAVSEPALFGRLQNGYANILVMTPSPKDLTGCWNDERLACVYRAVLDNLYVGTGKDLRLFAPSSFVPYLDTLDAYDFDAFHNW